MAYGHCPGVSGCQNLNGRPYVVHVRASDHSPAQLTPFHLRPLVWSFSSVLVFLVGFTYPNSRYVMLILSFVR